MSLFKRYRHQTPTVTVKVDSKELANLQLDGVQALVTDLATRMAKQEEGITRLQRLVSDLATRMAKQEEDTKEPSKVTLYANGKTYTVVEHDKEHIKGTVVGHASKK